MGGFIAQQPNGLYCRFSSIVECVTHYNMTYESYIKGCTGNIKNEQEGKEIIEHHTLPFSEVLEDTTTLNMTEKEWEKILHRMHTPQSDLYRHQMI